MKPYDLILTASANMFRSKVRTVLTIIAILIGALTITLTNGIGTGIKSYLHGQIGDFGATNVLFITRKAPKANSSNEPSRYNSGSGSATASQFGQTRLTLDTSDLKTISKIPGITTAQAALSPTPDYISGTNDKWQMTLTEQYGNASASMVAGKGVDNSATNYQVSVPISYVAPLGYFSNSAVLGKTVSIGITNAYGVQSEVTAVVTGVEQKSLLGRDLIYGNTALVEKLNALQNVGIATALASTFATVTAVFPSSYTATQVTDIKNQLSADGYDSKTVQDQENTIFTAVNAVIIVLDIFGVIALLAASFGIINTLYMSVQERTREIGLMKALGMSGRKIFLLFSIEAILIGFWGSVIGVLLAEFVGTVANSVAQQHFLKDFPGFSLVTFPASTIVVVIAAIMLIAFLAGTLPAMRAARKDPIDALRYE